MPKIIYKKTYSKDIDYLPKIHGQLLYCADTKQVFYDAKYEERIDITLNTLWMEKEKDLNNVVNPLINRIYIADDSKKIFNYMNSTWLHVTDENNMLGTIMDILDLKPTTLADKEGVKSAPRTMASYVYMNNGDRLSSVLDESNQITLTRTSSRYVQVEVDLQKVFVIPYPTSNYDVTKDHLSLVIRGQVVPTDKFVINNGRFILNTDEYRLRIGEEILFMFYYTVIVDLNDGLLIRTKNIADGAVTTPKLAQDVRIKATNIVETVNRLFFTPEEKGKLLNIEDGATRYFHPNTHPADMIVQDENRRMVSDIQISKWEGKPTFEQVYTKLQVDNIIADLIDGSPEALDTLKEISAALNGDPNFANTMINELAKKADLTITDSLQDEVDNRIHINDYVKGCIYGGAYLINDVDVSKYSITHADPMLQEYVDGMLVTMKATATNAMDRCKLAINNLPYKPVLTQDGSEVLAGEIVENMIYSMRYNGSTGNFILQGKGGVLILDTTLDKYPVTSGDYIKRSQPVDLYSSTIMKSIPRTRIVGSFKLPELYNGEFTDVKIMDVNKAVLLWKSGTNVMVDLFSIENCQLNILPDVRPLILELDCKEVSGIAKYDSSTFYISLVTNSNKLCVYKIILNGENFEHELVYETNETLELSSPRILKVKEDRILACYSTGGMTKYYLLNASGRVIVNESNIDYPIDVVARISDTQILFAGVHNNGVYGWVMTIMENNSLNRGTLIGLTGGADSYEDLHIAVKSGVDNIASICYREKIGEVYNNYAIEVEVQSNNGLDNVIVPRPKYNKYMKEDKDYSLSASTFSDQYHSMLGEGNGLYINTITDDGVDETQVNHSTVYDSISVDIYNEVIIAIGNKAVGMDIVLAQHRKTPHGVTNEIGSGGQKIKVYRW